MTSKEQRVMREKPQITQTRFNPVDIRNEPFTLGEGWAPIWRHAVAFERIHFDAAMDNVVRNPQLNSSVLLRADVQTHFVNGIMHSNTTLVDESWTAVNLNDFKPRIHDLPDFVLEAYMVRRLIPRSPSRDAIINQSCSFYTDKTDTMRLVIYTPHCTKEEMPFYLPKVESVALLYSKNVYPLPPTCSVHMKPFAGDMIPFPTLGPSDRLVRICYHLLETCIKHSKGVMSGYKKRVVHDLIVERTAFQDRYILMKQKYAPYFVANWVEKTDPRKHVFEDLGIAAFLIELWSTLYPDKTKFRFVDAGCGNGFLVHILIQEGFKGVGVDGRSRNSWQTYPQEVRDALQEKLLAPRVLKKLYPNEFGDDFDDSQIYWVGEEEEKHGREPDFSTFLIGNHSDELTLWLPLLGHPFVAIPCCSHKLSGAKTRFSAASGQTSAYAALVEKVAGIAQKAGWKPETEFLRIPSTRNAAVIGRKRIQLGQNVRSSSEIIEEEGGANGWLSFASALRKSSANH